MNKKIVSFFIVLLNLLIIKSSFASNMNCITTKQSDYDKISLLTLIENNKQLDNILSSYCIDYETIFNKINLPMTLDNFKVFEKNNANIFNIKDKVTSNNLLSKFLIAYNFDSKYFIEDSILKFNEEQKKNLYYFYKSYFPEDKRNMKELEFYIKNKKQEKEDIINYIASKISIKNLLMRDNIGNTSLSYVIITNNFKILDKTFVSKIYENTILTQKNLEGYNSLHFMFSPNLKNKNTIELNKKIIDVLTEKNIKMSDFPSLTYFEYAEIMKENNIDFYNKIKEKFKFTINNSNKNAEKIKTIINDKLDYKKKLFN